MGLCEPHGGHDRAGCEALIERRLSLGIGLGSNNMSPNKIREFQRLDPFRAFRIDVIDGSYFEITEQFGQLLVTTSAVLIGTDLGYNGIARQTVSIPLSRLKSIGHIA